MKPIRALALAFAALYAASVADLAFAQRYQGIMVEEPGTASRKKGTRKKPAETPAVEKPAVESPKADRQTVERPPPNKRPRGSSTYIPPPLQSAPAVVMPTVPAYQPPKIETFGDRVTRCNHSFPLNAGIGNNPTDRDSYVRQCAN